MSRDKNTKQHKIFMLNFKLLESDLNCCFSHSKTWQRPRKNGNQRILVEVAKPLNEPNPQNYHALCLGQKLVVHCQDM